MTNMRSVTLTILALFVIVFGALALVRPEIGFAQNRKPGIGTSAAVSPQAVVDAGNSFYRVRVNDNASSNVGRYTAITGASHPAGPNQNVLFGNGSPGTSFNSIRSYTSGKTYVQGPVPSGANIINLDPFAVSTNNNGSGITVRWVLPGSESVPDNLEIIQDVSVVGTTFTDSRIVVQLTVNNLGSSPVSIGIRYLWDYQIAADDGPTFQEINPDGPVRVSEAEFIVPAFSSYRIEDNDVNPNPPTFNVLGSAAQGEGNPPDKLQYASWPSSVDTAFDYTTSGQTIAVSGGDSAVLYYFGRDSANAIAIPPSGSSTVTAELFLTFPCDITCPSNITKPNDLGQCGAIVNYPAPTASANCGAVTCSPASGSFFSVGTSTVTCTGTGAAGNSNTCSFTVTVNDTQAPQIVSCPRDIVQPADANQCSAVVNYPVPGVTDNCPGATIICSPPSGQRLEAGTSQTVTCTATDDVGNKSECSFKISVRDAQPPTIVCPTTPVQIDAGGACTITVPDITSTVRNSISDVCTPASSLTVTQSPAPNSSVASDIRSINITVSDAAGVSTSCQVPVTVINSGGPAAQVTIGSGNEINLSVKLLGKKKNKKKVKPAVATGSFTIKNVKCDRTSLTLPFRGVRRVTDAGSGKPINDPADNDFFSVFTGCGNLRSKLSVGQNVTIGFGEEVCLTVEFNPTVPPVASATTNLSASEVLPADFKSEVVLDGISPVSIRALVDSGVKLINPDTGDPNNPVVTICQSSNNQFTVRYHAWSPSKADVRSVKYEFLDSSGGVIKTIDVDLAGPISGTSLVNGQSFNVEQSFSGTGVSSVRVTLNGANSSATATSGSISSNCTSAIQLQSQQRATLFLPGLTVDAVKP